MKIEVCELVFQCLKYFGIDRNPSFRMKYFLHVIKFWNLFTIFYSIFSSILFAFSSNDIVGIAESMGPSTTLITTVVKYIIFFVKTEDLYEIVDEINTLKNECKIHDVTYI